VTCNCGGALESENETIMRVLGIDPNSPVMKRAEEYRLRFVELEKEEMKVDSDEEEEEEQVAGHVDDESERDDDDEGYVGVRLI